MFDDELDRVAARVAYAVRLLSDMFTPRERLQAIALCATKQGLQPRDFRGADGLAAIEALTLTVSPLIGHGHVAQLRYDAATDRWRTFEPVEPSPEWQAVIDRAVDSFVHKMQQLDESTP